MAIPNASGFISVLPPKAVEALYEKIAAVPEADMEELNLFFAQAQTFTFDKQGRFSPSENLRQHAGISKEAVLVGSMSKFAIYSAERWQALSEQKKALPGVPAAFLQKYGI